MGGGDHLMDRAAHMELYIVHIKQSEAIKSVTLRRRCRELNANRQMFELVILKMAPFHCVNVALCVVKEAPMVSLGIHQWLIPGNNRCWK